MDTAIKIAFYVTETSMTFENFCKTKVIVSDESNYGIRIRKGTGARDVYIDKSTGEWFVAIIPNIEEFEHREHMQAVNDMFGI